MVDESQQEDDPLPIEVDIAEPDNSYTQSGDAVVGDAISAQIGSGPNVAQAAQAKVPFNPLEKGVQTEVPCRSKATQTQKRGRDRAVQTKEQGIDCDRAQRRAEEQKIAALQKEVRGLKVRYRNTEHTFQILILIKSFQMSIFG